MGVDFYTCRNPKCGETFSDCGEYETCCGCGRVFCDDRCAGRVVTDGGSFDGCEECGSEEHGAMVCVVCSRKEPDPEELLDFAAGRLGVSLESLKQMFRDAK